MGFDELSNTCLVLELGFPSSTGEHRSKKPAPAMATPQNLDQFWKISEPSLTLSLFGDTNDQILAVKKVDFHNNKGGFNDDQSADLYRQESTGASSFSNVSMKREREIGSCEEADIQRVSCEDDDGFNERKKLRLTKIQSALLEESFKHQSTLNPKQKQELARELKLRPRQVEVWFQNRRARTKLKQTELDCEFLKKCCDTLTAENRRLQKELKELRALKLAQPWSMQLPAATLTMCPSCERNGGGRVTENAAKIHFTMDPKQLCYNPFNNPSAAC